MCSLMQKYQDRGDTFLGPRQMSSIPTWICLIFWSMAELTPRVRSTLLQPWHEYINSRKRRSCKAFQEFVFHSEYAVSSVLHTRAIIWGLLKSEGGGTCTLSLRGPCIEGPLGPGSPHF